MEKFENNIKEKLKNRRIEPTDRVWASIDKKLDRSKTKRSKNKYFIYGIAAGILIILGFFGLDQHKIDKRPVDNSNELTIPSSVEQTKEKSKRRIELSVNELVKRKQMNSIAYDFRYALLDETDVTFSKTGQPEKELPNFQNPEAKGLLSEVEEELYQEGLGIEFKNLLTYTRNKIDKTPVNSDVDIDAESLLEKAELEIENETLKQKFLYALEKKIDQTKIAITQF